MLLILVILTSKLSSASNLFIHVTELDIKYTKKSCMQLRFQCIYIRVVNDNVSQYMTSDININPNYSVIYVNKVYPVHPTCTCAMI